MKKLILFGLLVVVLSSCIVQVRESVYVTDEPIATDLVPTVDATETYVAWREERRLDEMQATAKAHAQRIAANATARAIEATLRAEARNQIPTRTPLWSSCDVAYSAVSHVVMWAKGNYAHEACNFIAEREGSAGIILNWVGSEYHVICSDEFSDLIYEIIDTGDYSYGVKWCLWMRVEYGATAKYGQEDIFNLLEP